MFETINDTLKHKIYSYASSLIITKTKKTCTQLSEAAGVSHDSLYDVLQAHKMLLPVFPKELIKLAQQCEQQENGYLILDDTTIGKRFSTLIEGVVDCYDSSLQQVVRGLSEVVIAWTNGKVTIPLDFTWWIAEEMCPVGQYVNKYDLALQLIAQVAPNFILKGVMLDGLYATAYMITRLNEMKLNFDMRLAKNRVITVGGITARISKHPLLALTKNTHGRTVQARWQGILCYVTAEKRKDRNGAISIVYIVSNYCDSPRVHIMRYKMRWPIEKFFRTSKQYLGLKDCQALSSEKQAVHVYLIMCAYAYLQVKACQTQKECVEDVIKPLRKLKSKQSLRRIMALNQFFEAFA